VFLAFGVFLDEESEKRTRRGDEEKKCEKRKKTTCNKSCI